MIYVYSALLFAFWLLLSGHFAPLLMGLGAASVALTVYFIKRMDIFDSESFPTQLSSKMPRYLIYIFAEITKANIDVLQRIIGYKGNQISPKLIKLPTPQKTDLGRVIYANSITLTPGTVCVGLTKDGILVHALSEDAAQDLSTGDMAKEIPDIPYKEEGK